MGETSSRTSFRPSAISQSKETRWMPTRSGSGSTSSILAKLRRSRTGTSESGKNDPPQGERGAWMCRRDAARQTNSLGGGVGSVNPRAGNPVESARRLPPFGAVVNRVREVSGEVGEPPATALLEGSPKLEEPRPPRKRVRL